MMLGCPSSSFRMLISRIAVEGMPSSYCYSFIFLIATTRPVSWCLAWYTTPYVPSPIVPNI